jgi:hypothetical protein
MPFPQAFALYGLVILVSCALVAAAASRLVPVQARGRSAWIGIWLVAHLVLLILHPPSLIVSNVVVLGSAVGAGVLLVRLVPTPGALAALAIAASVADIVSFSSGPTRWLLGGGWGQTWAGLSYLAISLPVNERVVPIVGIGDLLLFPTFYLGLSSLGWDRRISFGILAGGLLAALAVGLTRGGAFGIPFMALGVLVLLLPSGRAPETGN